MTVPLLSLRVCRRYRARPEAVFRAFVDPVLVSRWLSPSADIRNEVLILEARRGGRYRFAYHLPEGSTSVVGGTYTAVEPPERLEFTWVWEAPDPHAGIETVVTVRLHAVGDGTEVVVTHSRFPDADTRDRHHAGWQGTLPRLEAAIAAERSRGR